MFLKIKNIPIVSWSSDNSFNFKPKLSTSFFFKFWFGNFWIRGGAVNFIDNRRILHGQCLLKEYLIPQDLSIGTATFFISVSCTFFMDIY